MECAERRDWFDTQISGLVTQVDEGVRHHDGIRRKEKTCGLQGYAMRYSESVSQGVQSRIWNLENELGMCYKIWNSYDLEIVNVTSMTR
jgi:hypothetical protein